MPRRPWATNKTLGQKNADSAKEKKRRFRVGHVGRVLGGRH